MHYRHLIITVAVGFGLLLLLFGSVYRTPTLQAASARLVEQTTEQQPNGSQGILAQLIVTPTKDNTLYEDASGSLSNGAGSHFFAGRPPGGAIRRGLLAFDLTGKLPVSVTIVSATLQLNMSQSNAGATAVKLHRLLANWGEGTSKASRGEGVGGPAAANDATWLHTFFNASTWATPGGVFVITPTATITVGTETSYRWSSPALLADVQQWVTNPATNFGWAVLGDESASNTAKRFDTRENPTAANRPQLIIVYNTGAAENVKVHLPLIRN